MSKVFFDVGVSLDGYMSGPNASPGNPLGDRGRMIHKWLFETGYFRKLLGIPGDGEDSVDNQLVRKVFARAGAHVMGRRMFDEGEVSWPEEAPFHSPVFVLTHAARAPWPRKGGTTFYFVTDGIRSALAQAKASANSKDVRISGGAATIRQFIKAGLIDEFTLHVAPMLLGAGGVRLMDQLEVGDLEAAPIAAINSPLVTHIDYRVVRR
jgi:dihydrofolate reductase